MFQYLSRLLDERLKKHNPVRVAIAGAGYMGSALIHQIYQVKGMCIIAIASRTFSKAEAILGQVGESHYKVCHDLPEVITVSGKGDIPIMDNPFWLVHCRPEIIVDLTMDIVLGAELGQLAMANGIHFITGAELDATVGPALAALAAEKKVVYSNIAGDEPGVIKELYDHYTLLGFNIVCLGKFKGFLNCEATPETVLPWAKKQGMDSYNVSSFADGTKMNLEMAVVSNATGFVPDCRGMHCANSSLEEVVKILALKEHGGILNQKGVVEVVTGVKPEGGVFIIVNSENNRIKQEMMYYRLGTGPNYMIYLPYHMPGFDAVIGILKAVLLKKAEISPAGWTSDVVAIAKRDIQEGETLDRLGGFDYYGAIDTAKNAVDKGLIPVCLAGGALVTQAIKKGEPITNDNAQAIGNLPVWELRKKMRVEGYSS